MIIAKPTLFGVIASSGCIGAGVGYIVAWKRLSVQFDKRLEQEMSSMRVYYQNSPGKKYTSPQEAVADLVPEKEAASPLTQHSGAEKIAYDKIVQTTAKKVDELAEKVAEKVVENVELPPQNVFERDETKPFVISQEEFMANERDYIQATLTYYEVDAKLCDENDDLIDEVEATVGLEFIVNFGHESSDENTVHVRSPNLDMDFEIVKSPGSFARDVLGVDETPMETPRSRIRGG
jgi:hypothetical protein